MADDDVARERARLEALAWGAATSPEDARRARLALQALGTGSPVDRDSSPTVAGPPAPAVPQVDPPVSGAPRDAGGDAADGTDTGTDAGTDGDTPATRPRDGGEPTVGGGAGLPAGSEDAVSAGRWTRLRSLLWTTRPRVWIGLGAAAAIGVAFAAGTLVGTARQETVAAPTTTPTPGTVTLEELLDIPQTYADQLPGPVEAPVSLRSTRLVFTNRALDGSAFETPWNVWAGVGTDRSTICLVATANRLESTTACYPREDALHGNVSLSAQSMSGTLTVPLRGGGVQGTVTNEN